MSEVEAVRGLPSGAEDFTPEWLSEVLGGEVGTAEVEQIGVGVGILGRIFRISMTGEGVPSSVVAKIASLDPGARQFVAEPLGFYAKEVRFYSEIADEVPLGTPGVYLAEHDEQTGDFVLVLEDLCDRRMVDQIVGCTPEEARAAVSAMADMHIAWWDNPRLEELAWLPAIIDEPYPEVLSGLVQLSWPTFSELGFAERLPAEVRSYAERLPDLMAWFLESPSKAPRTLVHGDYRTDNMFFAASDGQPPVTLVDWQIVFKGRGGYDLGYFVSQSLTTEVRREHESGLIEMYRERLAAAGIDYPDLERDYRLTVLYCLIYPIISAGQVELANERAVELASTLIDRAVVAIEDVRGLELLPER